AQTITARSAFMRYSGQGHEIEVPLPDRPITAEDIGPMTGAFEAGYRKQFSRPVPDMDIEILNWAVRVTTMQPPVRKAATVPKTNRIDPSDHRPIICDLDGTRKNAAVVSREDLSPGDEVIGPALITEPQTTTLVSADFSARVDTIGNLVLEHYRKEAH
ncbi:MAG: hydantoinase/oxoprolinase family protein, partial [Pseudomonadota bacterium]